MVRLKEHGVDIHHCKVKSSVVIKHSFNTKPHICLEKEEVLATVPHHFKRKIREALKIRKYPNNINQDDGLKLNNSWKPINNSWKPIVEILKNKKKNNKT